MKPGGYFGIWERNPETGLLVRLPIKNVMNKVGAGWFLETVFQDASVLPDPFYLGLTNIAGAWDDTLADIAAGEPSGNGYARQAIARDNVDWTVQEVNGFMQALSKTVTFTASSNWDKAWNRMFLTDASSGTSGDVIALSGPAPADRTVLSGQGPSVDYEFFLRG